MQIVALTTGALDWWHVWPPAPNAGDPLWIAFHSRLGKYDQTSSIPIEVKVGNASAVSGTFPIARAKVPKTMLAPGEPLFVHVPLCAPLAPGSAWTIVATFADGSESVAAGRTITTHFPIEYWPSSGECSIPGGSPSTWKEIQSHAFDTAFTQFDWSKCPNALAYQSFLDTQLVPNDFYALLTNGNDYPHTYEEADHTLGVLVADEADKNLGTPNDPNSGPKGLASKAKKLWSEMPSLAMYSGGSRSRYDGAYAGVTDIQGMDFYVAACAPHITDFGNRPPLRGAYDYAVLTRENQMPNPTWSYAQGFSVAWNANVLGVAVDRQPTAAEMRVQAYSAIASGAKGIMWFQGNVAESA